VSTAFCGCPVLGTACCNRIGRYAPVAGLIGKIHVAPGQQVEGKDLLFTISPQEPAV